MIHDLIIDFVPNPMNRMNIFARNVFFFIDKYLKFLDFQRYCCGSFSVHFPKTSKQWDVKLWIDYQIIKYVFYFESILIFEQVPGLELTVIQLMLENPQIHNVLELVPMNSGTVGVGSQCFFLIEWSFHKLACVKAINTSIIKFHEVENYIQFLNKLSRLSFRIRLNVTLM